MNFRFYNTGDSFDLRGNRVDFTNDGHFFKYELNLYVEYGVLDRLSLIGNFFFNHLVFENDFVRNVNTGFPYQEVGVRYQFFDMPAMSFQALVGIPTSSADGRPALSNNQFDYDFTYYIGNEYEWFGVNGFWEMGLGYRVRTGNPSDELRWYATLGVILNDQWDLLFQAEGIHGLGNGKRQFNRENVLLNLDFQLVKLRMSGLYHINENWALQVGPVLHLWGNNVGAGGGIEAAVWYEW